MSCMRAGCRHEYIVIPNLMAEPYPEEPQFTPASITDWKLHHQREELELSLYRVKRTLEEHRKLKKSDSLAIAEMESHISAVERTLKAYDERQKKT